MTREEAVINLENMKPRMNFRSNYHDFVLGIVHLFYFRQVPTYPVINVIERYMRDAIKYQLDREVSLNV